MLSDILGIMRLAMVNRQDEEKYYSATRNHESSNATLRDILHIGISVGDKDNQLTKIILSYEEVDYGKSLSLNQIKKIVLSALQEQLKDNS